MQNLSRKLLLTVLGAAAVAGAHAESTATEQIQEITGRTAVLEAQIKELELRNRVDKALAERAQRSSTAQGNSPTLDSGVGTPVVSFVEGRKDSLQALLVYPNGARQRVRVGDSLYGAVVQKIELNEVLLNDVRAKTTVRLQFAAAPAAQSNQTAPGLQAPSSFGGPIPPVVIPTVPR